MQMNRWLTNVEPEDGEPSEGTAHSPIRPRASVWIDPVVQQNVSASSLVKERRRIPNPQTPIPARASAQPRPVKVHPRYPRNYTLPQDSDITRVPTMPQPIMWQYELPDYDAESSLSALSLAYPEAAVDRSIDELDTLLPPRSRTIDELDTLPPPKQSTLAAQKSPATVERKNAKRKLFSFPFAQPSEPQHQKSLTLSAPRALSEIATIPPHAATVAVPRIPAEHAQRGWLAGVRTPVTVIESSSSKIAEEAASWTTGQGKNSLLAKRIASRASDRKSQRKSSLSLNPIDRVRWWLLWPGRIEFLLWLNGTIVLVGVTCLLLFATLLSTGWMNAGLSSIAVGIGRGTVQTLSTPGSRSTSATGVRSACTGDKVSSPQCHPTTVVLPSGLQLTHADSGLLLPDSPIYLYGQGFSPNNDVIFTYDAQLPCRPNTTRTDMHGTFFISLLLSTSVKAGTHTIEAFDAASGRSIPVEVSISPPLIGKGAQPTPTSPPPGVTPTANPGGAGGGGFPTPVGQTPVPIMPTVGITPTVAPTHVPTPTVGITPTVAPTHVPTPTVGITPTVGVTPTPTGTKHISSASQLTNALYEENVDGHITFSPWLWIAILGYALSMMMLGFAGLLYRRNRRLSSR